MESEGGRSEEKLRSEEVLRERCESILAKKLNLTGEEKIINTNRIHSLYFKD
jgi:hypothetical protein